MAAATLALAACGHSSPPNPPPPSSCTSATLPCPATSAFYQAPRDLASLAPGTVIRTRVASMPKYDLTGIAAPRTVIYASTDSQGKPIAASTTVFIPQLPWPGPSTRPLLSYQTAYDSLGTQCDPSYQLQLGTAADPQPTGLKNVLATGWAMAIPDYEGPKGEFAVGPQEGRAVLDGVKAAETVLSRAGDPTDRAGLWGYSGGGLATAWAAELQPTYAPGLDLVGAAEGGVPADLHAVFAKADGGQASGLVSEALVGISRAFPAAGIAGALNAAGRKLFSSLQTSCNGYETLASLAGKALAQFTTRNLLTDPTLNRVLQRLKLGQRAPQIPVYIYQGVQDELIPFATDQALVAAYCQAGVTVDHVVYQSGNHGEVAIAGVGPAADWLRSRFEGRPSPNTCPGQ